MNFPLESVSTPTLHTAFHRFGPQTGHPVLLLHGWPDSAITWSSIAPVLADQGYHVVVPYLRGYGGTRFRDPRTMRSGQLSALAQDVIDLADALGFARFTVIGHDWGARAAYISACLWPERVQACVAMSVGWGTNTPDQQLSLRQTQNYWYHWYMATARGDHTVRHDRHNFARHIWDIWCPFWKASESEFAETAAAFNNPDWADITLHSYRHRWGFAESDPTYAALESKLASPPKITVPTLVLHGADDPVNSPAMSEGREPLFSGVYRRKLIARCGHFPQREHPDEVARELVQFLTETA